MTPKIPIDYDKIAEFCRRHHIRRLAFFGSVLRDDFQPDSDVDVLVEFAPGQVVGLRFIQIQEELSQLLGGHKVDLVTPKFLNRRIRDRVLAGALVQYAGWYGPSLRSSDRATVGSAGGAPARMYKTGTGHLLAASR